MVTLDLSAPCRFVPSRRARHEKTIRTIREIISPTDRSRSGEGGNLPWEKRVANPDDAADAFMNDATLLLTAVEQGEPMAAEKLLSLVYSELRKLAASKMAREAPGHTLQPTALVHEAWLRLVGSQNPSFANRAHFFSAAAEAMRRILIDRARRKLTARHGGGSQQVELDEPNLAAPDSDQQLLLVNETLEELAKESPIEAEVVKLRYFAGMTNEEIAGVLNISVSSVKNYWTFARAWMFNKIKQA